MSIQTISPRDLFALRTAGQSIDVIDVRTPLEFREVHAEGVCNIPLDDLDPARVMQGHAAGKPLYLICRSGARAAKACEKFLAAGYGDVVNVEGGTLAWIEAGLPVVRGKNVFSLERQVRIAAGTLVLIGVALGFFCHVSLYGLAAFVGAGLIFAGVTNTCPMGLLIAKMPWNRDKTACGCEGGKTAC
jgi:rhodanese-related sulfurtransferase